MVVGVRPGPLPSRMRVACFFLPGKRVVGGKKVGGRRRIGDRERHTGWVRLES